MTNKSTRTMASDPQPVPPAPPTKPTPIERFTPDCATSPRPRQPEQMRIVDSPEVVASRTSRVVDPDALRAAREAEARQREEAARRQAEKQRAPFGLPAQDGEDIRRYKQQVRGAAMRPDLHPFARDAAWAAIGRQQAAADRRK